MSITSEELGEIRSVEGAYEIRLVRHLDHARSAVWSMLTEPGRIVEWLAPGEIEAHKGGAAKLNFTDSGIVIDSTVSEYEELALLEYSWSAPGEPSRPVRWDVEAEGDGTRLSLTLGIPAGEDVARSCAGWEAHLMMLLAAIEGVPIKFPFDRFVEARAAYNSMLTD